jgi:wyosine [tRNA(Phe)-imidazoG37] synthetase (radical SAM superfamily)
VNERKDFFPPEQVVTGVERALKSHQSGDIDWVTFVGSGETTLHASLGWMIRQVKNLTDLPVAVITNGSRLYQQEMRSELSAADAVLPSLDAGNQRLYRKINRPHPKLSFQRLIDGLVTFQREYQGKLWVEVMLVRDLNDTEVALLEIANVLEDIHPDEVHIVQPTRPPVETWVQIPDEEGLLRARAILGDIATIIPPAIGSFDLSSDDTLVEAVIGIITRHPMREQELVNTLKHWSPGEVAETLSDLKQSGRAKILERHGVRFWTATPAFFPEKPEE